MTVRWSFSLRWFTIPEQVITWSQLDLQTSSYIHWMFIECSSNVHWMFIECSLNVHRMFIFNGATPSRKKKRTELLVSLDKNTTSMLLTTAVVEHIHLQRGPDGLGIGHKRIELGGFRVSNKKGIACQFHCLTKKDGYRWNLAALIGQWWLLIKIWP